MQKLDVGYKEVVSEFSVGIPASRGDAEVLGTLKTVLEESLMGRYILSRIIVVASQLEQELLLSLRKLADRDSRILVIEESQRFGKWEAINRIISNARGSFLVLVNGDAKPVPGSILKLLETISTDDELAVVSALPIIEDRNSISNLMVKIFWDVHNETLSRLNNERRNNHSCDELMVVRLPIVSSLPPGVINDGAFIAGRAFISGYKVSFSNKAFVIVKAPSRVGNLMRQRRRIIFGHMQVWKMLGNPPRTMESIAIMNPLEAVSILSTIMARTPKLIPVLPLAIVEEGVSILLAFLDNLRGGRRHIVWDRYVS